MLEYKKRLKYYVKAFGLIIRKEKGSIKTALARAIEEDTGERKRSLGIEKHFPELKKRILQKNKTSEELLIECMEEVVETNMY